MQARRPALRRTGVLRLSPLRALVRSTLMAATNANEQARVPELPDWVDPDALPRCREVFTSIVPTMEGVSLIVASDFDAAVRHSHEDADYAANYSQDRGEFGVAVAKTIPRSDGTIHIIFDLRILARGLPSGQAERTFAHEAYHAAIALRGEKVETPDAVLESEFSAVERYRALAATAAEEFRVELALGKGHSRSHYTAFPTVLAAFAECASRLSDDYERSQDVGAISAGVLSEFQKVTTASGYVAAAMEIGKVGLPDLDGRLRRRVIGESGGSAIESLRRLPSAAETATLGNLENTVDDVAEGFEHWLAEIGFHWEDISGGGVFFRVLKPKKWLLGRN
jgi:hypothetical protein